MIACTRCASKQLNCIMSSLFKRCSNCVTLDKNKCEFSIIIINFDFIDRVMFKLKKKNKDRNCLKIDQ